MRARPSSAGLGIVILAVVLDRISQGLGQSGRDRGHRHWWQGGPVGLVLRLILSRTDALPQQAPDLKTTTN